MFRSPATPALKTVRGFHSTPAASGDEDSDCCLSPDPRKGLATKSSRSTLMVDDVVSANCSPSLRPVVSPAMSGISMLRMHQDIQALSLDTAASSRASSMTSKLGRRVLSGGPARQTGYKRSNSSGTSSGDETASVATESYEINLEHDFAVDGNLSTTIGSTEAVEIGSDGGVARSHKMTADDFESLRCLGKGTYGTVLLVKQRTTGRLFAQKQFKKASLVVHKKLVEQTKTELQILESVNRHPFVVKLFYAFQDQEKLYLILEYGQGGELFTHLNTEKMFSESTAAFYMAEMVLALSHLHTTLGVVYRDLKPENCLLDSEGHLLLTDFGLSKVAIESEECNSMLGTVEYMAPEVIQGKKYGRSVDWWSLGALGFDLMTGNPPFRGGNNAKIQENIVKQKLIMPYFLTAEAKDLLTRLLRKDPAKRLGSNMPKDLDTIKKHRFFRKIDWKKLAARELEPPIQPMITDPELAENFAPEFTELSLSPVVSRLEERYAAAAAKDDLFGGFSFVASNSLLDGDGFGMRVGTNML
ncbi:serine/threonine-protein kinase psk1 [Neurospora tetrasperma FGSC 2508]|uniref:Serine/threonine-protein kinase psk1 n=1 Tax=Neurospora tetrasperma (strain FGSC 2508 / ATCC MYA-4615 / P0657) TaxID=510951 RepID=F8N3K9_NEUT8|nr:serine/threonine-protein kinase psk1 [Neurospora tetrasperma FGSC 2508]EGO52614.1 serine/threonine-protein kinase psk1 [Neurospora tetrasperma FGSC 2508]